MSYENGYDDDDDNDDDDEKKKRFRYGHYSRLSAALGMEFQ